MNEEMRQQWADLETQRVVAKEKWQERCNHSTSDGYPVWAAYFVDNRIYEVCQHCLAKRSVDYFTEKPPLPPYVQPKALTGRAKQLSDRLADLIGDE